MDSTSRVKIEYTDPSKIYPLLNSELLPRLPLRELHWSSSSRPIRSISSLHIELVSDDGSISNTDPTSTEGSSSAHENGLPSKSEGLRKERRHQIPGLRRTPYLKIYLLDCNDVDTYKASSRKQLREWVKDHTTPVQSSTSLNKQDNHDAFEWLIVHVIPPSAEASTDTSRSSSSIKNDSSVEKRPSSSRWPSRSSTSVIEKIRADFNGTSKNFVDRVAQIQLAEPPGDRSGQVDRRNQDGKNGWDDMVSKIKFLILASFDLRVSQYEEDIREREGQKKVFGWNFNTFFVLKEGLAMGFENMGLVEDSLTVYQELAFGLKAVIEEQQSGGAEQQTAHFVDYTEDLYENFRQAEKPLEVTAIKDSGAGPRLANPGASILNTDRKAFREMILSNKISIFDFQCYVFARQVSLSLRLANAVDKQPCLNSATASQIEINDDDEYSGDGAHLLKPNDYEPENLLLLAEVAKFSAEFITSTARTVREDIQNAINQSQASQDESEQSSTLMRDNLIENFVMSWLFSACQCVLEATSARSLTAQLDPLLRQLRPRTRPNTDVVGHQAAKNADAVHRQDLPSRTSSLPSHHLKRSLSPPNEDFPSLDSFDATKLLPPGSPHPGGQDLAAERGDLIALKRRLLSSVGIRQGGWRGGLAIVVSIPKTPVNDMQDVNLEEGSAQDAVAPASGSIVAEKPVTAGLCNPTFLSALKSSIDFYAEYETLTIFALAHYVVGNRSKAAESMTADLALARFHDKDYAAAASFLRQLAPFYAKSKWSDLEITMLDIYAQCLKHLDRIEEYIRVALKGLARIIQGRSRVEELAQAKVSGRSNLRRPFDCSSVYLSAIISASTSLEFQVSAQMNEFFEGINLGTHVRHLSDQDSFVLPLTLHSLLPEAFQAQSVRVRIVCHEEDQRSELWLAAEGTQTVEPGIARIALKSSMMQPGWYVLNKIQIQSSNINFLLDLSPSASVPLFPRKRHSMSSERSNSTDENRFLIWPKSESLEARLTHYETINLERPNSIKAEISTGRNNVLQCKLSLRPASAGLRLHIAETMALDDETTIEDKSQPGAIAIGGLSEYTSASIKIPYSMENDLREINVRVVIDYTTPQGNFSFSCNTNIPVSLPLAINVQDSFKQATLVSKFTIGTSTAVPVCISSCHLEGNRDFGVISAPMISGGLDIFVRQPLSMISKIYRLSACNNCSSPVQSRLFLKVTYRSLDEVARVAVEEEFLCSLSDSPFRRFVRILRPALLAALRSRFTSLDLEIVGVLGEISIAPFEEWDWGVLLGGLALEEREELGKWLRNWHEAHPKIQLKELQSSAPTQHLTVPVDLPRMQVLHTARLKRLTSSSSSIPIGQGLPMELVVSHTRQWEFERQNDSENQAYDFCFEIQANPDVWLVGGQRKGHFSATEGKIVSFALLLWPQKTGHLLLPSVEVQALPSSQHQSREENEPARPLISCDMDYQNASETVLVVPDLISTTVSLDPGGTGTGWLVESKSKRP